MNWINKVKILPCALLNEVKQTARNTKSTSINLDAPDLSEDSSGCRGLHAWRHLPHARTASGSCAGLQAYGQHLAGRGVQDRVCEAKDGQGIV